MEEEAPSVSPRKLHRIRGVFLLLAPTSSFPGCGHLATYLPHCLQWPSIPHKLCVNLAQWLNNFAWGSSKQIDKGRVQKNHDDDDCRDGNNVLWGVRQN